MHFYSSPHKIKIKYCNVETNNCVHQPANFVKEVQHMWQGSCVCVFEYEFFLHIQDVVRTQKQDEILIGTFQEE